MATEQPKPHSLRWIRAAAAGRLDKKPHSRAARRKRKDKS